MAILSYIRVYIVYPEHPPRRSLESTLDYMSSVSSTKQEIVQTKETKTKKHLPRSPVNTTQTTAVITNKDNPALYVFCNAMIPFVCYRKIVSVLVLINRQIDRDAHLYHSHISLLVNPNECRRLTEKLR